MTIESESHTISEAASPPQVPSVTVMRYVTSELSDGKIAGVLIDKAAIPSGTDPFCFTQEFKATILPEQQTLFKRGVLRVKSWLLDNRAPRYRVIPHS